MKQSEIELCIVKYGKDLYSFCCYLTYNKIEADDLYQDTFLKVMELGKLDEAKNPKSYLLSIAVRLWKNSYRKQQRRSRHVASNSIDELEEDGCLKALEQSPESELIQKEQQKKVRNVVQQLPEKLQIVALLYYMEDRKVADIAKILHVPQGTVKSRLHKARKLLREKLEDVL